MTNVLIHYINGSMDIRPFPSYEQARYFVRGNISYSGGRVRRVEIVDQGSVFAAWDISWNDASKAAGLNV